MPARQAAWDVAPTGVQSQLLLTSLNEDSSSWGNLLSHTINVITSITNVTCRSSGITKGPRVPYLSTKWQTPFLAVVCRSAAHSSRSGKTRPTLNAQGQRDQVQGRARAQHRADMTKVIQTCCWSPAKQNLLGGEGQVLHSLSLVHYEALMFCRHGQRFMVALNLLICESGSDKQWLRSLGFWCLWCRWIENGKLLRPLVISTSLCVKRFGIGNRAGKRALLFSFREVSMLLSREVV